MKKILASVLCAAIVACVLSADAHAIEPTMSPVQAAKALQLHGKLMTLGSGRDALMAVRLRDGHALSGWVADVGAESFTLVDIKTGEERQINYAVINRMAGYNLATGTEVQENTGLRGKLVRVMKVALPTQRVQGNSFAKRTTLIVGIVVGAVLAIILVKVL